jgi:NitT/TauT family transport system permease protein
MERPIVNPALDAEPFHDTRWTWAARLGVLAVGVVAWEGLAHALGSLMLPSASATLAALIHLASGEEMWRALWISNQALVLGYFLAAALGVPLGLLLGRAPPLGALGQVALDIVLFTPMPAVLPILVMATGLGLGTRVLVVFLFAVAIIAVHASAGARSVDAEVIDMARAFGATRVQLGRRIIWPAALPAVLVGLRVGLSRAVSGMVAVELLLVAVGIGRLIERYQGNFDAPAIYAVVLVVVVEAVLLAGLLRRVERRLAGGRAELALA